MAGPGETAPPSPTAAPQALPVRSDVGREPIGYWNSLVLTGLFGLVVATVGLTIVSWRRRLW